MKLALFIFLLSLPSFSALYKKSEENVSCYSDYNCGIGEACLKENSWDSQGICLKVVDRYGLQDYSFRKNYQPQVMKECLTLADCPSLFKCERIGKTFKKTCVR